MRRSLRVPILLLIGLIAIAFAGCSHTAHRVVRQQAKNANWQLVQSAKGYQIELPPDWKYQHIASLIDLMALSTTKAGCNINIVIDKVKKPVTCMQYAQQQNQLSKKLHGKNFQVNAPQAFTGQATGVKSIATMNMNDKHFKMCQYDFVKGNAAYVVTMTTTVDDFQRAEPEFDRIARTFTLRGK